MNLQNFSESQGASSLFEYFPLYLYCVLEFLHLLRRKKQLIIKYEKFGLENIPKLLSIHFKSVTFFDTGLNSDQSKIKQ